MITTYLISVIEQLRFGIVKQSGTLVQQILKIRIRITQ